MKTLRIFSFMAIMMAFTQIVFGQNKTEVIPVSGNCEMCKKTIEKAAKKAGAATADWNVETKLLSVSYNNSSTNAARIQQGIAASGYDTRDVKADGKAYDKLPHCCKYERAQSTDMSACCDSDKCGKSENCCAGMDCCKDGKCSMEKKAGQHDHAMKMGMEQGSPCCENGTCKKQS